MVAQEKPSSRLEFIPTPLFCHIAWAKFMVIDNIISTVEISPELPLLIGKYPESSIYSGASQHKREVKPKMEISAKTMGKIEDWLETIPSKFTRKTYRYGIRKFEKWYGDSITNLIKSPKATRTVEKFFVYLKQHHPQNTCRNVTNSVIQFLKHFDTKVEPKKSLHIYRTERAIDKHLLTISEVQQMAGIANLRDQVMLSTLLLGLRIRDTIRLKKDDFDLNGDPPIPLKLRATKEGTVYETFISAEFKELLEKYIPLLESKWLFPGIRKGSHVKDETLNNRLRRLAEKAGLELHGRLTWHTGRKLVMRTGAELGLNIWNIKRLVGKSIPISDDTYLAGIHLKEDFIKIHEVLKLERIETKKLTDLEDLTHLTAEALAELLRPIIKEKFSARFGERPLEGPFPLVESSENLEPREILRKFLERKKKERRE